MKIVSWLMAATLAASAALADAPKPKRQATDPMPPQRADRLLKQYGDQGIDANGDGSLTREEVTRFFDANPQLRKSGKNKPKPDPRAAMTPILQMVRQLQRLNPDEMPQDAMAARNPALDTNGDGRLSPTEWLVHVQKVRQRLTKRLLKFAPEVDQDRDGKISDKELDEFATLLRAREREQILAEHPTADRDGDGKLSDQEYQAFTAQRHNLQRQKLLERYPEADTNKDGVLSVEELRSFRAPDRPAGLGHGRPRKGSHPAPDPRPEDDR